MEHLWLKHAFGTRCTYCGLEASKYYSWGEKEQRASSLRCAREQKKEIKRISKEYKITKKKKQRPRQLFFPFQSGIFKGRE